MPDSTSSINGTSSTGSYTSYATGSTTRTTSQTLNQNDFLKLLVTQLSSQDPLNPMKDTEFISQMAQFSALEQSKAMQAEMTKLRADFQLQEATSLIGRNVEILIDSQTTAKGTVTGVTVEAGTPKVVVNGQSYDMSSVLGVTAAPTQN